MKILVTGSRGLVGKNVSNYLQKRNPKFKVITTNRSETDLFSFNETKKLLHILQKNILELKQKVTINNYRNQISFHSKINKIGFNENIENYFDKEVIK